MVFYVKIVLCILVLKSVSSSNSGSSLIRLLRSEPRDIDIYEATIASINDWEKKQIRKRSSNRLKREDTLSVCYPELGCFDASGPFGYLDTLPAKPEEIGTKFMLYPGKNRRKSGSPPAEVPFEKIDEAFEWAKQGFNSSLPTKVLIHGFGSHCSYIWAYEIRSALMAVEEVNIICVDWTNGAALPNYVKASANTRLVGKQLSILLRGLVERNGLSLMNTHLIGFSLGAHIAGFTGADLGNLSRITGLDPAGPLFESQDPRARLDQTDAAFVDVIHSNGENLILGGLGSSQPMGHVDFYPNGGRMQKGCSHLFVGAVSDIIWSSPVEGRSLCNHRRAYKFFIDSISPRCHFPAFPCASYEDFLDGKCFPCTNDRKCGNMGYYADRSKGRGQLYLVTREEEPFCAHQYHVKLETIPTEPPLKSYGKIQITLIGESFLNETFTMTKKDDEEMILGQSISRILVPHPILAQLTRIQILYTAYTGWLSSGLTQWKMDKVTLMDSFGKISSVCRKNLILQSGVPVMLPLHPGDCKISSEEGAEDRFEDVDNSISNETSEAGKTFSENRSEQQVSFREALNFFNIPWRNDKENDVLNEAESSRAFNTRTVKIKDNLGEEFTKKEIVEPILRPQSTKNARSHDPSKDKVEITEPILGPTTVKNVKTVDQRIAAHTTESKPKEVVPVVVDSKESGSEWVPKEIPVNVKTERKLNDEKHEFKRHENPLEQIATTVQFIPNRLARMFEQAEKYARETLLPLVSTYTPRFISDIITPKDDKKYVPLKYDEPQNLLLSKENVGESRNIKSIPISLPIPEDSNDVSTPYSHIQKIRKKDDTPKTEILQESASNHAPPAVAHSTAPKMNITIKFQTENNKKSKEGENVSRALTNKNPKAIYINLPVFEEEDKIKYIPLRT